MGCQLEETKLQIHKLEYLLQFSANQLQMLWLLLQVLVRVVHLFPYRFLMKMAIQNRLRRFGIQTVPLPEHKRHI
jgi:hypothetical protein